MNHILPEAEKVRNALRQKGIETPMIVLDESKDERRTNIEQHMREVFGLCQFPENHQYRQSYEGERNGVSQ